MVNKVILIGNAGADPEIRCLENGVKLARLKIATTERIYNSTTGERRDHTEWHSLTLWRGQADFAERYIRKGTQIYVEGKIRSREFVDDYTGLKRTIIEIHADDIKTLGRKSDHEAAKSSDKGSQARFTESTAPAIKDVDKDPDNTPF